MSTFLFNCIEAFDERWVEVDRLICAAQKVVDTDTELHDVLCRSAAVLISAHLEGYCRELTCAIVKDINSNVPFTDLPDSVKRTFCTEFIPDSGEDANNRVERLMQTFSDSNADLLARPFLAQRDDGTSRNPKPTVIERIGKSFGVKNIFAFMADSTLDDLFTNSGEAAAAVLRGLDSHARSNSESHPYTMNPREFSMSERDPDFSKSNRSMLQECVDEVLSRRHRIAHGSEGTNNATVAELERARQRVQAIELSMAILVAKSVTM